MEGPSLCMTGDIMSALIRSDDPMPLVTLVTYTSVLVTMGNR